MDHLLLLFHSVGDKHSDKRSLGRESLFQLTDDKSVVGGKDSSMNLRETTQEGCFHPDSGAGFPRKSRPSCLGNSAHRVS